MITTEGLEAIKNMIGSNDHTIEVPKDQIAAEQSCIEASTSIYQPSAKEKQRQANKVKNSQLIYSMYNNVKAPPTGLSFAFKRSKIQ